MAKGLAVMLEQRSSVIISVPVTPDYSKIPYAIMLQYALERIC
jgi:hypothetical protein